MYVDPIKVKIFVTVLCAAVAVIAALTTGILAWLNGTTWAGAFLAGGAAFVVWLPLALTVANALGVL